MDMNSFYGGPNGQSFSIKRVFATRNGLENSLISDLNLGWASPIYVGEYVLVSYGVPGNAQGTYESNREVDVKADGYGSNFSLWIKEYNQTPEQSIKQPEEYEKGPNGLIYRCLGSMSGNTPKFSIEFSVSNADIAPTLKFKEPFNPDAPVLVITIPQSQILSLKQPTEILDANEEPRVVYDEKENINRPTLQFFLPQAQVIEEAKIVEILDVGTNPEIWLDNGTEAPEGFEAEGNVNHPIIKLKLPASQEILPSNIKVAPEDADTEPYLDFDNTGEHKNNPILTFHIPKAQVMVDPDTKVVGPDIEPDVALNPEADVNSPQLMFKLPRAVKFYYGSLLGQKSAGTYTLQEEGFDGYAIGDYYINEGTGFIYIVTNVEPMEGANPRVTFQYVACVQQPLPTVSTTPISPYTLEGEQNNPSVERQFTNEEQTTWGLKFNIPKAPKAAMTYEYVGSIELGSANVTVRDQDTVNFDFKIPTGSKLFSGLEVDDQNLSATVEGARAGDLYLNSETGKVYILQNSMQWVEQRGSLKGPVGENLHIVRDFKFDESIDGTNSLDNGVKLIKEKYEGPYSPEDIFGVTWKMLDEQEIAYWYYCTEEVTQEGNEYVWGRVQLTGNMNSFFANDYTDDSDEPITNKGYSINYINKLIGQPDDETSEVTTYSKKQIIEMLSWGTW